MIIILHILLFTFNTLSSNSSFRDKYADVQTISSQYALILCSLLEQENYKEHFEVF
jgi:hypothetical protein